MPELNFFVPGKPVTQGSMNPGRNGKMFHKAALQPWRDLVWERAVEAAQYMGYMDDPDNPVLPVPRIHPVRLHCIFGFAKPAKPTYDFPARADVDKLCRAVGDAISVPKKGRRPIITDDDQITNWYATKIYTDNEPGADITITW